MSLDTLIKVLDAAAKYGPWVLCGLLIWWMLTILMDEDRSALLRGRIYKILFRFTGRTDQEKKYIANDIRGQLNLARRHLCPSNHAPGKAVEVVWVEGGHGEADDIKEGEFIVRLDPSENQARNIALMATAVVKKTIMLGIRHSVELPLQTAVDLNVVRKLLARVENRSALDWFLSTEYEPVLNTNAQFKDRNDQILALDERGLFTRILLIELEDFGRRIYGLPPRPYMAGEVEGLVAFLYQIASKQVGHDVPLQYYTAFIRTAVVIVAKTAKVLKSIQPYMLAIQNSIQHEPFSIYIIGFDKEWLGDTNPAMEDEFKKQVERLRTAVQSETVARQDFDLAYTAVDFTGKHRKARCIRYVTPFK